MSDELMKLERVDSRPSPPRCSDFDEDCDSIEDKLHCWLYDPAKGACPFLSTKGESL